VKIDGCAAGHVHTAIIEHLSNAWALAYRKAADHKRPFRAVSVDCGTPRLGHHLPSRAPAGAGENVFSSLYNRPWVLLLSTITAWCGRSRTSPFG
jgi:hypothetical protein